MNTYQIIYADPPWSYRDKCHAGKRGIIYKYSTMSIEEIRKLPVNQLAAKDCMLFLWSPMPMLSEAFKVIKDWGFVYKTVAFNWIKTNKKSTDTLAWGMGNWTRANGEVCLLGTKGKPKRVSAGVHSVVIRPRMEHSQKPPEVRERIVELCGDISRIELFARERDKGWHVFGDEVNDPDLILVGSSEDGKSQTWKDTSENKDRSALDT